MGNNFQSRLLEGMNLRGLKQVDLAERTGLSKSRISHYTSGRYEAKQEALYLIAKALDVNEAWLMGHDVSMERDITEHQNDLSTESYLLDQIQMQYGKTAVNLLMDFIQLNKLGQQKAAEQLQDLLDVPKYRKDREE